jgi:hypothetical protein
MNMNILAKAGAILGGGAVITALASGGPQNATETPVTAPVVTEQQKVQQKASDAQSEPKKTLNKEVEETVPKTTAKPKTTSSCHPSYSGCLKQNAGDYDCAGGSGNGPNYTGAVEVYGSDPFDLDRDNDGMGCE